MNISENELREHLKEYRKAIRALMWFYDSSNALCELLIKELQNIEEINTPPKPQDLSEYADEDWGVPQNITFDAYQSILRGTNHWYIKLSSQNDWKMRRNSFYIEISLYLDYWSERNNPDHSESVIEIIGYRINEITGNTMDTWNDDTDEKFYSSKIAKDLLHEKGEPKEIFPFENIPLCSWKKEKYKGDYAIGLYDLSKLIDEKKIKEVLINDIQKLVSEWS